MKKKIKKKQKDVHAYYISYTHVRKQDLIY